MVSHFQLPTSHDEFLASFNKKLADTIFLGDASKPAVIDDFIQTRYERDDIGGHVALLKDPPGSSTLPGVVIGRNFKKTSLVELSARPLMG